MSMIQGGQQVRWAAKAAGKVVGFVPAATSAARKLKPELKAIAERFPEVYDKVAALEAKVGRTFWPPNRTPSKFCSKSDDVEREIEDPTLTEAEREAGVERMVTYTERVPLATAYDVKTWALTDRGQAPGQISIFPEEVPACQSKYALCE